jgi:hypothetical protein
MPTEHILALLIAERDKLNRAIEALQGPAERRGRRTGSAEGPSGAGRRGKRGSMSAEARAAQSERMKAYWAKRRKQTGKKS